MTDLPPKREIDVKAADDADTASLTEIILEEWAEKTVPRAVLKAAEDITGRYKGHVHGILYYGSCLRTGEYDDKILDFYVIVDDYWQAYASGMLALANQILPPNVFYHEIEIDGILVRSKYAVLSRRALAFRVSESCLNVSVWARFCQPCLLMLAKNSKVRQDIASDIACAVRTMLRSAAPLLSAGYDSQSLWVRAFSETYRSELRSEGKYKGQEIYQLDRERYDTLTPFVSLPPADKSPHRQPAPSRVRRAKLKWFMRRSNGKLVSFLRLIKASFTFDGGIDYLAWKITRHSGVDVDIKPWMRRVPVLAGLYLFVSLRLKGAFR